MNELARFEYSGSLWALAIGHDGGHPRILGCAPEGRNYLVVPTRGIGRIIAEQGVNGRWDADTGQRLGHPAPFDGWSACVVCLDERERREWLYQTVWRPRGAQRTPPPAMSANNVFRPTTYFPPMRAPGLLPTEMIDLESR